MLFANCLRNVGDVLKVFRAHLQDVSVEPNRYKRAICVMFSNHLSTTPGCLNTIGRLFFTLLKCLNTVMILHSYCQ